MGILSFPLIIVGLGIWEIGVLVVELVPFSPYPPLIGINHHTKLSNKTLPIYLNKPSQLIIHISFFNMYVAIIPSQQEYSHLYMTSYVIRLLILLNLLIGSPKSYQTSSFHESDVCTKVCNHKSSNFLDLLIM